MTSYRALVPAITAAIVFTLAIVLPFAGCGLPVTGLPGDTDGGVMMMICNNAAQCDDQDPCTTETCDNGVCGHAPVAKGPAADQTAGDCKTVQCDGAGVATDVDDDQDIVPDMNPCTIDACRSGAPTHDNAPDMTACTQGALTGLCMAGTCAVSCTTDAMCDDMNPCTTDACDGTSSLCVHTTLNAVLTPGAPQPMGDCRTHVCVDGKDTNSPDDSDLPNDMNECHNQQCNMGVPAFPPLGLNAPCGAGKTKFCDGADACVECNEAGQCPGTTDDCQTITCTAKACGVAYMPLNTPVSMQTPHDCYEVVCDGVHGAGTTLKIVNDLDLPDDGNDCTTDVCTMGAISHVNNAVGLDCGMGGKCAAGGVCGCATDAQCTMPNTCGGGVAGVAMPFICGCTPKNCAQVPATCGPTTSDGCFSSQNCDDAMKDGAETDVDCGGGGGCVTKCAIPNKCLVDSDCASGHCADGICCNTACNGTCQACTAMKKGSGSDGMCGSILVNLTDDAPVCSGNNACDGNNNCKKINGQACGAGGECVSGSCADGVCCNTACNGACLACNLAGTVGTCSDVASGQMDPVATSPCTGNNSCDGAGTCKKNNGQTCAANSECLNNACADGYCCNSACTGTCMQCNKVGSLGVCSDIASGQTDPNAAVTCVAPNACDGMGNCKKNNGQTCGAGSECVSTNCADGYCCNGACTGTCKACNLAGNLGTCSNIGVGLPDPNATVMCVAPSACDGGGNCKKNNGQTCVGNSDCLSGACADGYCCNSACTGTCMQCNQGGALGTCSPIALGQGDPNATVTCTAAGTTCDGAGSCKKVGGQTCVADGDCANGHCADGYCCNNACTSTCMQCNKAGSLGTCSNIPSGTADANATVTCVAPSTCDGNGNCKKNNGQGCATGSDCLGNICVDGVCCNAACAGTCQACNVVGSVGTCSVVASGSTDANGAIPCNGPNNACDGAGNCRSVNGQPCSLFSDCVSASCIDGYCCNTSCLGTCMTCNVGGALGTCSSTPKNGTDTNSTVTCVSPNACDGTGNGAAACKIATGQPSGSAALCVSGFAADGYCCDTACTGTCMQCSVGGLVGTCSPTPQNMEDTSPASTCVSPNACDGLGNGAASCKLALNQSCTMNSDCASNNCNPGMMICK